MIKFVIFRSEWSVWAYRFIHRDVYHLVENNEDFKKIYPRFAGQVMQQGQKIYQAFVDAGLMKMTLLKLKRSLLTCGLY
jgi:hypothetical protein